MNLAKALFLAALSSASLSLTIACTGQIASTGTPADEPRTNTPQDDGGLQTTPTAATTSGGDGGAPMICCPADPTPSCCMHYGGWVSLGGACGEECDGMPVPSDPSWRLIDNDGCPTWTSNTGGTDLCGSFFPDSGPPAIMPTEAGPAPTDPGCPPTFDELSCGQSCTFGTSCSYPGGKFMTCISVGAGGDAGQSTTGSDWFCGN